MKYVIVLTNEELRKIQTTMLDGLIYHKRNMIEADCSEEEIKKYSRDIRDLIDKFIDKGEEE